MEFLPVFVSVAVVNGVWISAISAQTGNLFTEHQQKVPVGAGGVPSSPALELNGMNELKMGLQTLKAKNPFLFLVRSFPELIQGFSWSTPEHCRGSDKRKRSQNAPKKLLCIV